MGFTIRQQSTDAHQKDGAVRLRGGSLSALRAALDVWEHLKQFLSVDEGDGGRQAVASESARRLPL